MADNTTLNSGTGGDIVSAKQITKLNGSTIATGEKVQRVLLVTKNNSGDGITDVTDIANSGSVPVTGTVTLAGASQVSNTPTTQTSFREGFARAVSGNINSDQWSGPGTVNGRVGSGMAVNQTGGNLVITTGTTVNSETILRANAAYKGNSLLRFAATLSQRIANQSFFVELIDYIGDALAFTMNSATSVTVTFLSVPADLSGWVGQSMNLGAVSGIATAIPGRYAVASVSGSTVTFTVAGWTASGSGTLSLFGRNYHRIYYDATSATGFTYDSAANGYSAGVIALTCNTTASGHLVELAMSDGEVGVFDQTNASFTGLEATRRGSRNRSIPGDDINLILQIRIVNGSTAPASTTTFTLGFVEWRVLNSTPVSLVNVSPMSANTGMPVEIVGSVSLAIASLPATPTGANKIGTFSEVPQTSGGLSLGIVNSAASTNLTSMKATAGQVYGVQMANTGSGWAFLKLYAKSSAPVLASDAPNMIVGIPPGGRVEINRPSGIVFLSGIAYAITGGTTGAINTDTTAVAANQVVGTIEYA